MFDEVSYANFSLYNNITYSVTNRIPVLPHLRQANGTGCHFIPCENGMKDIFRDL